MSETIRSDPVNDKGIHVDFKIPLEYIAAHHTICASSLLIVVFIMRSSVTIRLVYPSMIAVASFSSLIDLTIPLFHDDAITVTNSKVHCWELCRNLLEYLHQRHVMN
jgi:hypothetical protein